MAGHGSFHIASTTWEFISDRRLRESLKEDTRELRKLLRVRAWKSAIVMCGVIIETVLVDQLLQIKLRDPEHLGAAIPDKEAVMGLMLGNLVNLAVKVKLIEPVAEQLQVRDLSKYRNLIHPGRQHLDEVEVDASLVQSAIGLLNRVLKPFLEAEPPTHIRSLFRKIKRKRGADEADVARAIYGWATTRKLDIKRTTSNLIYLPALRIGRKEYAPISIWPDGHIQIKFRHLSRAPYFDAEANRIELKDRLNQLPGVKVTDAELKGYPYVYLSDLLAPECLELFLSILGWMFQQIEQSGQQPMSGQATT